MIIDIYQLPECAKLEVTKDYLIAFAHLIINETSSRTARSDTTPTKEILTLDEAAQYLNLAKQTLYGMTSKNEIPFLKRSRKIYFRLEELERYLLEGRRKTKDELAKEVTLRYNHSKTKK